MIKHDLGGSSRRSAAGPGGRRAFTISELIVAVGVAVLLIVGIGRIFSTTRTTISTGEASASLTQSGRTLERLLRQDFAGIIRNNQAYMVIRNERLGSGQDVLSRFNRRRGVYLSLADEEAGRDLGTVRLDQIVFYTSGEHASYQYRNPSFGQENIISRNDSAPVARVWWGHGLRDPNPTDNLEGIKGTMGLAGYRAQFADERGQFALTGPDLVNKYAGEWVLARQPALLLTRDAAGCNTSGTEFELNFAPSPIEIFNEFDNYWFDNRYFYPPPVPGTDIRRRFSPGYVDLIDMDLSTVMESIVEYGWRTNRFTGAREIYPDPLDALYPGLTGPLGGVDWNVDRTFDVGGDPSAYVTDASHKAQLNQVSEQWARQQRYRMMYSTGRIRIETALPSTERLRQMLTHATLLEGCSNFEVAWSNGEVNYPEGDLVWYDINNPANPYARHPNLTNQDVYEQTPDDARTWYLTEVLPPSSGLSDAFTTIPNVEPQNNDLYYAVFGAFVPRDNDASRGEAWPWPKLIRVRLTLHDAQGRIGGGREFEFIFNLPDSPDRTGS